MSALLRKLCDAHAKVGRCILCGRGPFKATTPNGVCKYCALSGADAELLEALEGHDAVVGALKDIVRVVEEKLDPTDGGLGCVSERDEMEFWEAFGKAREALSKQGR
jgi:hypothetical protein